MPVPCVSHDIERQPDVNALLPPCARDDYRSVRERGFLGTVSEGAGEDSDATASQRGDPCIPESMPEGIVGDGGHARVEGDEGEFPGVGPADRRSKGDGIVVRVEMAERFASRVKEVLPVDEGDRTLGSGFSWHAAAAPGGPGKR